MILGLIALLVAYESLLRLLDPVAIDVAQALPNAAVGLAVNRASVWLLHDDDHQVDHDHHGAGDHDTNVQAAHLHCGFGVAVQGSGSGPASPQSGLE